MTDKERLTNIIHNAQNKYLNLLKFESSLLADYLIANGVILPPCKVGDTVYTFSFDKIIEAEVIKVEWSCEAENYGKFIRGKITLYSKEFEEIRIDFYDLDKLFYLTREEAEKALERSKGNA